MIKPSIYIILGLYVTFSCTILAITADNMQGMALAAGLALAGIAGTVGATLDFLDKQAEA